MTSYNKMKIQIKVETDTGECTLNISDESLINDNYIDMWFSNSQEGTINIDELYSAIKSFKNKRTERLKKERFEHDN